MAEDLLINRTLSKEELYKQLFPQLKALVESEKDELANRANFCAALKETFNFLWVGFYRLIDNELVLGTFQGPVACTRIQKGRGVCGQAWEQNKVIIVEDVDLFQGHISCSSASKSEIVLPLRDSSGKVYAVLDIDDTKRSTFDEIDKYNLEKLLALIS